MQTMLVLLSNRMEKGVLTQIHVQRQVLISRGHTTNRPQRVCNCYRPGQTPHAQMANHTAHTSHAQLRSRLHVRCCTAGVCVHDGRRLDGNLHEKTHIRATTNPAMFPFGLEDQCRRSAPSDREREWRNVYPTLRVRGPGINPQRTCTLMWVERRNTELE